VGNRGWLHAAVCCHVGHGFTADAVLAAQGEEIERTLGRLQRSHQERAVLNRKMADLEHVEARHNVAQELERRAHEYAEDAQLILELMRNGFGTAAGAANDEKGNVTGDGEDEG
jgi:two-component system chemotaxis response regulator CheB